MLRTKDMITMLLDGLEIFLGVGVMFLNSSNSKMAGGMAFIGHQVERAVRSRYPTFCVASDRPTGWHRFIRSH